MQSCGKSIVVCMYCAGQFYVRDYAKFCWIWNCCLKCQWLYKAPSYIFQLVNSWQANIQFQLSELKGLSNIVGRNSSSVCKNVVQGNVWYLLEKKYWNIELHTECGRDIQRGSWTSESLEREFYDKMCYSSVSSKS